MSASVKQGLAAFDEIEQGRTSSSNQKVNWLVVPKNGKVRIVFLQELDTSSERYSEQNGLALLATEHHGQGRDNFFKRFLCTKNEEGGFKCWGCEKNSQAWDEFQALKEEIGEEAAKKRAPYSGGWGAKTNLYINVLNLDGENGPEVAVLQRNHNKRSYTNQILELAREDGFISNRLFTLGRTGEGFDTVYALTHRKEDAGINVEDYDLFDLHALLRDVEYDDQARALGAVASQPVKNFSGSIVETDPEDEDSDDAWL